MKDLIIPVVWVTKYTFTGGVQRHLNACVCSSDPTGKMIAMKSGGFTHYFHKPDWHTTPEEAVARVEEMKKKKIASLTKAIKKVNSLVAEEMVGKG